MQRSESTNRSRRSVRTFRSSAGSGRGPECAAPVRLSPSRSLLQRRRRRLGMGMDVGSTAAKIVAAVAVAAVTVAVVPLAQRRHLCLVTYSVASAATGAAAIHYAVVAEHFDEWWGFGLFFVASAVAQLVWAVVVVGSRSPVPHLARRNRQCRDCCALDRHAHSRNARRAGAGHTRADRPGGLGGNRVRANDRRRRHVARLERRNQASAVVATRVGREWRRARRDERRSALGARGCAALTAVTGERIPQGPSSS